MFNLANYFPESTIGGWKGLAGAKIAPGSRNGQARRDRHGIYYAENGLSKSDQRRLEEMADDIFELYQLVAVMRSRQPSGGDDLSETEFLSLDALAKSEPLTIGEIQKQVGVAPAQMSRVIRSLEKHGGRGYVECRINPQDRRRVDVSMTSAGRVAYDRYRSARLASMFAVLEVLEPEDREVFMGLLGQIRSAIAARLETNAS